MDVAKRPCDERVRRSILSKRYWFTNLGTPNPGGTLGRIAEGPPLSARLCTQKLEQLARSGGDAFAAPPQNAAVNGPHLFPQRADRHSPTARDRPRFVERHDGHSQPRLDHPHDQVGIGGFNLDMGREAALLKRLDHMLPPRRAPLIDNERIANHIGQLQSTALGQRMIGVSARSASSPLGRAKATEATAFPWQP